LEKQRAQAAAARAEQERIDVEQQAKRERLAAEAEAEFAKIKAEIEAELKNEKAEQEARDAEERRKVLTACRLIYQTTADKKIRDLTVKEEQQVRACQALGLFPPR
jgi:hypothetical protein